MKQYIVIKESAQSPANYLNILSNYYYNFNKTRALRRLDNIALYSCRQSNYPTPYLNLDLYQLSYKNFMEGKDTFYAKITGYRAGNFPIYEEVAPEDLDLTVVKYNWIDEKPQIEIKVVSDDRWAQVFGRDFGAEVEYYKCGDYGIAFAPIVEEEVSHDDRSH